MKKLLPICTIFFMLSACSKSEADVAMGKFDLAHEIMSRHPSDTTIAVEPGTEKLFEKSDGWYYVCGRAVVNQPGLFHNFVQRFIISVNPDKKGMTRYEGGNEDKEFLNWWAKRCDGYVLPPAAVAATK